MIGNFLVSSVWIANTAAGNNGSMLHMVFYRTVQASAALALLSLGFEVLAYTSYATEAEVWKSWAGLTITTQKVVSAAANGGAWSPSLTGDQKVQGSWTSDKKNILWKAGEKIARNSTDFKGESVGAEKGFD